MIYDLKVGFNKFYLTELLNIFDVEVGYESAFICRKKQPSGCKGLVLVGKSAVLDSIEIIDRIWSKDDNYAKNEGVKR